MQRGWILSYPIETVIVADQNLDTLHFCNYESLEQAYNEEFSGNNSYFRYLMPEWVKVDNCQDKDLPAQDEIVQIWMEEWKVPAIASTDIFNTLHGWKISNFRLLTTDFAGHCIAVEQVDYFRRIPINLPIYPHQITKEQENEHANI